MSPRQVWKARKPSEMRLVMSRLVSSLRAAGFPVEQQIDAAINLGRAFGVPTEYLKQYLEQNVSPKAGLHRFFRRDWRPLFRVGDPVRARIDAEIVEGTVRGMNDPSELGLPGLDRPVVYEVELAARRVHVPETDLEHR